MFPFFLVSCLFYKERELCFHGKAIDLFQTTKNALAREGVSTNVKELEGRKRK